MVGDHCLLTARTYTADSLDPSEDVHYTTDSPDPAEAVHYTTDSPDPAEDVYYLVQRSVHLRGCNACLLCQRDVNQLRYPAGRVGG